jgi:hypothetical protein
VTWGLRTGKRAVLQALECDPRSVPPHPFGPGFDVHDGEQLLEGAGRETPWSAVAIGVAPVVAGSKHAAAVLTTMEQLWRCSMAHEETGSMS